MSALVGHVGQANLEKVTDLLNQAEKDGAINWSEQPYKSVLCVAASKGNKEVVQVLLDHGATANPEVVSGTSPLHWAAMNGHTGESVYQPSITHKYGEPPYLFLFVSQSPTRCV